MPNSMLNKWDYSKVDSMCYSDREQYSYKKPAEFLGNNQVEDWGGGTGWAKRYFSSYKNIDGSKHKNVDIVADLTKYVSKTDNILMRQVLEFNLDWKKILKNVKDSFAKRFCLVVMTPMTKRTYVARTWPMVDCSGVKHEDNRIPDIYFNKKDILDYFPESEGYKVKEEVVKSGTGWKKEWILYVEKV